MKLFHGLRFLALAGIISLVVVTAIPILGQVRASDYNSHICPEGQMSAQDFLDAINSGSIRTSITIDSNNKKAEAVVHNDTECAPLMSLASYSMFDKKLSTQKFVEADEENIKAGGKKTLAVSLPSCMAQIDLYYGQAPRSLSDHENYEDTEGALVVKWAFYLNEGSSYYNASGQFCGQTPPPPVEKVCKLEISKQASKASVSPGEEFYYTISFKNVGTLNCTGGGVHIKDMVNDKLKYVGEEHTPNVTAGYNGLPSFEVSTKTAHWNADTLTPGEEGEVKLKVKSLGAESYACGSTEVSNVAKITAAELDNFNKWITSNEAKTTVSKSCNKPSLDVKKNGPDKATRGQDIQYQISVKNNGVDVAQNLVIEDIFPDSLIFKSASHSACGSEGQKITCRFDALPASGEKLVTLTFTVSSSAPCEKFINQAKAWAGGFDSKESSQETEVQCGTNPPPPAPDLEIKKKGPSSVTRGEGYYYEIEVKNVGSSDLSNIVIKDSVPTQTSFVKSEDVICSLQEASVQCEAFVLKKGELKSFKLYFRASENATCSSDIINTAKAEVSEKVYSSNEVRSQVSCGSGGGGGGGGGTIYTNITLQKQVKNVTLNGEFADQIVARPGDEVEYKVVAKNTGSTPTYNLLFQDALSANDILSDFRSLTVSESWAGSLSSANSVVRVSKLDSGKEVVLTYRYTVSNSAPATFQVCNTVRVTGDYLSAPVSDNACVSNSGSVGSSNVFLNFSKKAFNDTLNIDATKKEAKPEHYITYTLKVSNSGNSTANNFVVQDDLSGVLSLADIVDYGGATLAGNTLSFPPVNVPAGGFVEKTFRVRVKAFLPSMSYVMRNVYGNTVDININKTPPKLAPQTGGFSGAMAAGGSGLFSVAAFVLAKKKFKRKEPHVQ